MIALLGKSDKKNTELQRLIEYMDLPCAFVSIEEKTSGKAYTPWNYYACGGPDDSEWPFFWLDLSASPYWSFRAGDIRRGQIYNGDELIADVYFREPYEDQCIDRIEWIRNNEIYAKDYCNASGLKYCEEVIYDGSERIVKYFDREGRTKIVMWPDTGCVSVRKGDHERIHEGTEQFYNAFLKDFLSDHSGETIIFYETEQHKYIPEGSRSVLFLPEQSAGELEDSNFLKTLSLVVTDNPDIRHTIGKFSAEDSTPEILEIGRLIDKSVKHPVQNALIVTRSQHIEQLQPLVEGLTELHFHIAAGTMMAPGLMEYDKYDNVTLYPNSSRKRIMELMNQCAFYLDINHYLEYEGIVLAAQKMDRLVYAFDNTVHQRASMPEEHIYAQADSEQMVSDISRAMYDPNWLEKSLDVQRKVIEITSDQIEVIKKHLLECSANESSADEAAKQIEGSAEDVIED